MSSPEEDSFDDSSSDDSEQEQEEITTKKRKNISDNTKQKRKKIDASLIDDAAVLSGEDDDEDEDDEDGDDNDDYVRDDFVVDEVDDKKENDDGLEDSDDDSSDDDGEQRGQRIRKLKDKGRLDDDDLALIDEAKGISRYEEVEKEEPPKRSIKARTEAELRKELFDLSDEELEGQEPKKSSSSNKPQRRMETYDEDGMDDFIEYGDDEDRRRYADEEDDMMGRREGISEAQLNEATDIFGSDFMDFFQTKEEDEEYDEEYDPKHDRYRERGVGVDLGVDSEEEMESSSEDDDDDDDLFGDDEDADGLTKEQRAEALRLKKEKRQLAKEERRRAAAKKKSDRRRAKLRRAFEPVQLVENFCTERDDEIRSKDIPERFFDWSTPFHGPANAKADLENDVDFSVEEQDEATWMVSRIPEIQSEYNSLDLLSDGISMEDVFAKQREIVVSIMQALRYMHIDNLEPEFIRKYRADYVTSKSVRENLYAVMDEDAEWDRILNLKKKVHVMIDELNAITDMDDAFDGGDEHIMKLKGDLKTAEMRLIECTQEHDKLEKELKALEHKEGEDLDDELFGDDDDEALNVKVRPRFWITCDVESCPLYHWLN
jgi:transcription elongation factor SPT6